MNAPALSAIIESLLHPQGRFRTLVDIVPLTDARGMPRFTVSSDSADFEATVNGAPCLLRFPLGAADLLPLSPGPLPGAAQSAFLAPCRYLREEMTVFDGTGTPLRTDLLLERLPAGGMRLSDFVRTRLDRSGASALRRLLEGLAAMYRTFDAEGYIHGHLKAGNILVTPDSRPTAVRCLHSHARDACNDRTALLRLSLAVYVSGCMPPLFHALWSSPTTHAWLTALLTQAEFDRNVPLARAAAAAAAGSGLLPPHRPPGPEETAALLDSLSTLAFVPLPLLAALMPTETPAATARDITVSYTAAETSAPQPELLDAGRCDYIGRPADTVVRYRKGDRWGYADTALRPLTAPQFTSAGDFHEGRAAVACKSGYGLLDRSGNYVMEPRFEALEWYGEWNVAAACAEGEWHLYDRCGKRLTASGYDWMAPPAEGALLVRRRNRFGFIDPTGRPLTELRYDEGFSFSGGRALVRTGDTSYFIDREGERIE